MADTRGFTLVELLVALLVASIASMAMVSLYLATDRQQQDDARNQDVWQQARLAMVMLSRDAQIAGFGLYDFQGCLANGQALTALQSAAPAPGDAQTSDFMRTRENDDARAGAPGTRIRAPMPATSLVLKVGTDRLFQNGDWFLIRENGLCDIQQVKQVNPQGQDLHLTLAGQLSRSYSTQAEVINLGPLSLGSQYYHVGTDSHGQPALLAGDTVVANGIVSLQVAYRVKGLPGYQRPNGPDWFQTYGSLLESARIMLVAREPRDTPGFQVLDDEPGTAGTQIRLLDNPLLDYTVPADQIHKHHIRLVTEVRVPNVLATQ